MQFDGWTGFLTLIALIRTLAEVLPVNSQWKKAVVAFVGFILSYYFRLDALALLGLHIDPTAWHAHTVWLIANSTAITLATYAGHDALDKLAGKEGK